MAERMRVASSLVLIFGQIVLLFLSREVGICLLLAGSVTNLPFYVKHRHWDVVSLILFGMAVNLVGLFVPPIKVR
jgi:hypothetical protein